MYRILTIGLLLLSLNLQAQNEISGKALLGNLRARSIGPAIMSGRISDIDVVNSKPEIIYVGTAGGGVWKSNSGGTLLRPVFDDHTQSIGKVTIDQKHPDTVWVGTGESWVRNSVGVGTGIYKTVNGGTTWELMGLADSEHISDIQIDPTNSNIVYVAAQGKLWGPNQERGVYKTMDGGKTWSRVFFIDENTGCADLELDPTNPQVIYAAMWSHRRYPDFFDSGFTGTSGLFKSTDGGKTWNKIHNGLPNTTFGRFAIAVAPTNSKIVYLTVEAKENKDKGLYKSTDAGASWKKINEDFNNTVRPFYFAKLYADPTNDSTIIKAGLSAIISNDGGTKFRPFSGSVHSDFHAFWINPKNPKHILMGTDGGVYESMDAGYTARMWMNLPVGQFYHVSVDNEEPYNVYGGLQDNGSWYGPSLKSGGISNNVWQATFGGDGFWSFRHPVNKNIVYAEYQGGNLVRYNKETGIAKDIRPYPEQNDPKFRFNWNTPIQISKAHPDRLYIGGQFLFLSEDMGDTWKKISPDLTTNDKNRQRQDKTGGLTIDKSSAENNTTIYTIAESPLNDKIVWVGTDDGHVQVTTDLGTTWTKASATIAGLPPFSWCSHVEPGTKDVNTAFVTFDNHRSGDFKPYIYKTTDLGKTWTSLATDEIKGHVYVIRQDLINPDLLFVGTEFGLFVSTDAGKRWTRFETNLPKVAVHDLAIHPTKNALVIATHGRSLYIIDDITPLRQITPEILKKPIHFFTTVPTILRDPGAGGAFFSGDGQFIGENPNTAAQIIYFMGKRHTFGKMTIEVYDQSGKLIKELPAGKSAGLNIVEMPAFVDRPKAAPSDDPQSLVGTAIGPNLAAGTYNVKLIKGKEEYTTSFTLAYDANTPYSIADREIRQKAVEELYEMTEKVGYNYYLLDKLVKDLEKQKSATPKLAKKIDPVLSESKQILASIIFKGGDFYINTEQMLGERIGELYGQVLGFPGKPSNSQLERIKVLRDLMAKSIAQIKILTEAKLNALNENISKAGGAKIGVLTQEEFRSKSGTGSSGSLEKFQKIFLSF